MSRKAYCLDTSVLIENPKSIEILRNGDENLIYLSNQTVLELDGLKKSSRVNHIVKEVVDELHSYINDIIILNSDSKNRGDSKILDDILNFLSSNKSDIPFIFVTNDNILSFRARKLNITTQVFKDSNPYQSDSQRYTGILSEQETDLIPNCFFWNSGKLFYCDSHSNAKILDYENQIWKLKPKTIYQNCAMELLLNPDIDIVSIQSEAGFGKSILALASGFYWTFEKKKFNKIFIFKHTIDVGNEKLGFLPGDLNEKIEPYFRPIKDLVFKLHKMRPVNKAFITPTSSMLQINPTTIEYLPLNFVRGMNIDNAYVIIDEMQNFSRQEVKVILSRMGENTRVVCLGDVGQIDSPYLNESNNGLNWVVKAFKGLPNYGHIVLKGKHSRGKIADMTRNSIL